MSTATTSDKFTTDKYTQIRGELRAVLGHGATGAGRHRPPRGPGHRPLPPQPRLRRAEAGPLGGGATAILADDTHVWLAGTDGHIYKADLERRPEAARPKLDPAPTALAFASKDRLAAVCGKELVIVGRNDGKELQRLTLGEFGAAIASDPPASGWSSAATAARSACSTARTRPSSSPPSRRSCTRARSPASCSSRRSCASPRSAPTTSCSPPTSAASSRPRTAAARTATASAPPR
jgi:hypothetical protein